MLATVDISAHAKQRWTERVDSQASFLASELALRRFLKGARGRPTPRHWLHRPATTGTLYVFNANYPGICVLVTDRVAVTVLTRQLCRTSYTQTSHRRRIQRRHQFVPSLPWDVDEAA
jgi:hypothetical protein